ncbi:serine hydrolase [Lactovum odontotermitis]
MPYNHSKLSKLHQLLNILSVLIFCGILLIKFMPEIKAESLAAGLGSSKTTSAQKPTAQDSKPSQSSRQPKNAEPLSERAFSSELAHTGQSLTGNFSLAIYDVSMRQTYTYQKNTQSVCYTASTIKLSVLTELLLSRNSDGRNFDANLTNNIQAMMRNSSNDATSAIIFESLSNEADPIQKLFSKLGMNASVSGLETDGWGLSTTSPQDQLILLKNIFLPSKILTSAQQAYIKNEMQNVEAEQQWGISQFAAAADVKTLAVKNGWGILDDNNLIVDNSIGSVTLQDGRQYLIASYGSGFHSDEDGIAAQEALITAAGLILTEQT